MSNNKIIMASFSNAPNWVTLEVGLQATTARSSSRKSILTSVKIWVPTESSLSLRFIRPYNIIKFLLWRFIEGGRDGGNGQPIQIDQQCHSDKKNWPPLLRPAPPPQWQMKRRECAAHCQIELTRCIIQLGQVVRGGMERPKQLSDVGRQSGDF